MSVDGLSPGSTDSSKFYRSQQKKQEEWRCTDPFLNKVRKEKLEVELYLKTGVRLVGFIDEYDKEGVLFYGSPGGEESRKQLIFRVAIATIVLQEGD